jgi:hypothetical protein
VGCVPFDPDRACCDEWDALAPELQERADALAWSTLRALTAGQVGNCPAVVRPCLAAPCSPCTERWGALWSTGTWMTPYIRDGNWHNCTCSGPTCNCKQLCDIVMPGPIAAILNVDVGGCAMPLDTFVVVNGNRIARTDGECWPACVELTITYLPGIVPDAGALWAAGVLACEFSKACTGAKCRLPSSVTTIARQGVSFNMEASAFPGGMTGIREVDGYIVSVNPNGLKLPPMVWSPDAPWTKHRYLTPQIPVTP